MNYSYSLLLILFFIFLSSLAASDLTNHIIDTGHGDEILIKADGKKLLLDSGDYNIREIIPIYLRKAGLNNSIK